MKFSMPYLNESRQFLARVSDKFFLTIFRQKDELFYVALERKQVVGQLFVEDIYDFPVIFCKKSDRRMDDIFFLFSFMVINARSLQLT